MRIVFNMSGALGWRRKPVGIIRVERELLKQLLDLAPQKLVPVALYDDVWRIVPKDQLTECVQDEWGNSSNPDLEPLPKYKNWQKFAPLPNDAFISVGSDWAFDIPEKVEKLYPDGRNLVAACYDLIPILYPQFTPNPQFYDWFRKHYKHVRRIAGKVFAISDCSKRDLEKLWAETSVKYSDPEIKAIPLAGMNDSADLTQIILDEKDQKFLDMLQEGPGYVIFVSTLEPRKNHILLANIWKELYLEYGEKCPRLLFVGMSGWGSADLLQYLSKMDVTQDSKLIWAENLTDDMLKQLYANCLFALHPSVYEGWGLAATEVMSFGKVCLVSNNSALPEATQGLLPSFHPHDFPSWKEEIKKLIDSPSYRADLEKKVTDAYQVRTWRQFGQEFLDWIEK